MQQQTLLLRVESEMKKLRKAFVHRTAHEISIKNKIKKFRDK